MATSPRSCSTRSDTLRSHVRRLALVLGSTAIGTAGLLILAAPASALVEGNFGLQRRAAVPVAPTPLQYHGGPVLHSSDAYVIYWDPIGTYRGDWERLIDKYFADVGTESRRLGDVFAVDAQYGDGGGQAANISTFRGSYKDADPYPTSAEGGNCAAKAEVICLTDRQIQGELQHLISSADPPLPGATGTPVYYLLTPPGVTVCTEAASSASTCSYSKAENRRAILAISGEKSS